TSGWIDKEVDLFFPGWAPLTAEVASKLAAPFRTTLKRAWLERAADRQVMRIAPSEAAKGARLSKPLRRLRLLLPPLVSCLQRFRRLPVLRGGRVLACLKEQG